MYRTNLLSVIPILFVVGCAGSSSPNQTLLDDRIARGDALEARLGDLTDPAIAVFPGTAQYTGTIVAGGGLNTAAGQPDDIRVLFYGDLVLDVDFDGNALTGEGRDFVQVRNLDGLLAGDLAEGTLSIDGLRNDGPDKVAFDLSITGRIDGTEGAFIDLAGANLATTAEATGPNAEVINFGGQVDVEFDKQDGYVAIGGIAGR